MSVEHGKVNGNAILLNRRPYFAGSSPTYRAARPIQSCSRSSSANQQCSFAHSFDGKVAEMSQVQIHWPVDDRVTFHGRSGTGKCAGLLLTPTDVYVTISPVTSRGRLANCSIDVPLDRIPELIEALDQVRNGNRTRAVRKS